MCLDKMDKRPALNKYISITDFKDFYWLKSELQEFCKKHKIPSTGAKIELAKSIEEYLLTGKIQTKKRTKALSTFNWQTEDLSLETIITDSYKNSENVRAFFKKHIGSSFKFNVGWMNWIKENTGKTLQDAIDAYHCKKLAKGPKTIAPQFEFNAYMKACKKEFPSLSHQEVVKMWNTKRTMRGQKVFEKTDLAFLESK